MSTCSKHQLHGSKASIDEVNVTKIGSSHLFVIRHYSFELHILNVLWHVTKFYSFTKNLIHIFNVVHVNEYANNSGRSQNLILIESCKRSKLFFAFSCIYNQKTPRLQIDRRRSA
ncbi:hypothetical protein D3C74_423680 [compost metagenome]